MREPHMRAYHFVESSAEDPVAVLAKERFGLDYLFPYQRLAVANVLDAVATSADAADDPAPALQIVLLPTGFGKSLCFQLPALLLPGPTIVVYPLLALMEDQRRRLAELGIPCALFRGGQDDRERHEAEEAVASGRAKIVITNPECLSGDRLLRFLEDRRPSHVAIDEAHCVAEWGETFRPAYLELGGLLARLAPAAVSAFTATASPTVLKSVAAHLFGGAGFRLIEGNPDRPNLAYGVVRTLCRERSLERLALSLPRPLIVFCSSRDGTQILARLLAARIRECELRFYHAGLSKAEKTAVEEWFFASRDGILISTCAYGMGVDKRDIRSIVHFEAPSSIEAYLQESGRAGRDGERSEAILLSAPDDGSRLRRAPDQIRRARAEALLGYAASRTGCRRSALLGLLGAASAEESACSGCDRCEGRSEEGYEGQEAIVDLVGRQPRRFDLGDAVSALGGAAREGKGLPVRCAGWGALADWAEEDIRAAIVACVKIGLLRLCSWPWKGRLAPVRKRATRRPLRLGCLGGRAPSAADAGGRRFCSGHGQQADAGSGGCDRPRRPGGGWPRRESSRSPPL